MKWSGPGKMADFAKSKSEHVKNTSDFDVKIKVENFGPVKNGSFQIRPLNIFVGKSNTGKTFTSVLLYALHNMLDGFSRIPVETRQMNRVLEIISKNGGALDGELSANSNELKEFVGKLRTSDRPFMFSDLPKYAQEEAKKTLLGSSGAVENLEHELLRCFNLPSISELITAREETDRACISVDACGQMQNLWNIEVNLSETGFSFAGRINDIVLITPRNKSSNFNDLVEQMAYHLENGQFRYALSKLPLLIEIDANDVYYLPAARSGIMQSHGIIASSAIAHAVRAGLDRSSEFPNLPGPLADFMQLLIKYPDRATLVPRACKDSATVEKIAKDLQDRTLGGEILANWKFKGGYPEFFYKPGNAAKVLRNGQISSMVTELAPLVLFMRHGIGKGDTLIMEEPEAHLHPAAQTDMAFTLAQLVNAGVRVVATTHSDWLLKAVGNLIRAGEFKAKTGGMPEGMLEKSMLRPEDVGVWLFRENETGDGSMIEEIPFNRIDGIEPEDYEDVEEELYNRSAELQNRFAEVEAET